jgi:hypothetical protein
MFQLSQSDDPQLFSLEAWAQLQKLIQHNMNILRNQVKFEKCYWFVKDAQSRSFIFYDKKNDDHRENKRDAVCKNDGNFFKNQAV